MPSLKALEKRIEADRAAIAFHRRQLKQAVNRRVGSTTGLASGFAVGFTGGWLLMGRRKRRREQALHCPPPAARRPESDGKESKLALLRTLMMVSMPLWQKMLMPSAPPGGDDAG